LLVNSTISFLEKNNSSNVATTFMVHLTPKTKVCQHILIWSLNDVVISPTTCPNTSLGPKLCGQVLWLMWWIVSTWWRFSCFESDSVSSKSSYVLSHHGNENYSTLCCHVFYDGKWSEQDVVILVLGDVISIKLGDIIPIDVHLLDGNPLRINQVLHNSL
jgi:magnesium-transporting ATPase (P-type)